MITTTQISVGTTAVLLAEGPGEVYFSAISIVYLGADATVTSTTGFLCPRNSTTISPAFKLSKNDSFYGITDPGNPGPFVVQVMIIS